MVKKGHDASEHQLASACCDSNDLQLVMVYAQTCVSKCECRIHQLSRGQALLQVINCRTRKAHHG